MEFEWDPQKARTNLEKHGVSFDLASLVFTDARRLSMRDTRQAYGEDRRIVLGQVAGRLMVVVVTARSNPARLRIISARKANARERKQYDDRQTKD
jgi:uncharacterized DUF497 family protein